MDASNERGAACGGARTSGKLDRQCAQVADHLPRDGVVNGDEDERR
jgi:hypothetical protein